MGIPFADDVNRKGFDPTPFQRFDLLVNGVTIPADLASAYSLPDGWVSAALPDDAGALEITDDGRGILYWYLEGAVSFRLKKA